MLRKGIIGGTFDPIHIGHLYIASEAMYKLNLDQVIFMPSGNPPHKTKSNITKGQIRYDMVKDAIANEEKFVVNNYEINKDTFSYTYETLEHFKNIEPDCQWYFITGADCLRDLHLWRNVDRILKAATLVVFNRPGMSKEELLMEKAAVEKKYNTNIVFMDLLLIDISSSYIRERIKEGKKVDFFLNEKVYKRIIELGLYKE